MRNVKFYSILYEVLLWLKDNTNLNIPYQHRTNETALNAFFRKYFSFLKAIIKIFQNAQSFNFSAFKVKN